MAATGRRGGVAWCRIVALAALLATGGAAAQPAGQVEFVSGAASIRGATGVVRPAHRDAAVLAGETVEVGDGRVQLRMSDGAFISLQAETSLRIDEYGRAGAPAGEGRGFLSLLRGGLRTITGLIGRTNHDDYRLKTTTATIGIRGTGFAVSADDGTRVSVTEGLIALCNDAGCIDVRAGQTGFTPDARTRPTLAFAPVRLPPVASRNPPAPLVAEVRDGLGVTTVLDVATPVPGPDPGPDPGPGPTPVVPLASGPGGIGAASVTGGGTFSAGLLGGTVTFASSGELTQFTDCCSSVNDHAIGSVADFGADGVIAWGRWTSGVRGGATPLVAFNYVGNLSANAVTAPNIIRGYTAFASTAPVITSGATVVATGTPDSVTGSMTVNFPSLTGGGSLSYNLAIPVAGQTFTVNGSANQFSSTGFLGSSSTIASTGAGCTPSCTGNVPFGDAIQGFFTGASAERAGANYGFTSSLGQVSGAVVFH